MHTLYIPKCYVIALNSSWGDNSIRAADCSKKTSSKGVLTYAVIFTSASVPPNMVSWCHVAIQMRCPDAFFP